MGRATLPRPAVVGAALFLGFSLVIFAVGYADDGFLPPGRRVLAALSLAALYAAPGALAVLAARDRPALLVAGGVLGLLLIPTSMTVTPLLLLPAVLLLVAWSRVAARPLPPSRLPVMATVAVAAVLGMAAFLAGFSGDDGGGCWSWTEDAGGHRVYRREPAGAPAGSSGSGSGTPAPGTRGGTVCVSDTTTPAEASGRFALVAVLLAAAYRAAGPAPAVTPTRSSPAAST